MIPILSFNGKKIYRKSTKNFWNFFFLLGIKIFIKKHEEIKPTGHSLVWRRCSAWSQFGWFHPCSRILGHGKRHETYAFVIKIYTFPQGCGSGSAWIRMDPHSFSLLNPNPGGKKFQIKTEKCKKIGNNYWYRVPYKLNKFLKVKLCTRSIVSYFWLLSNLLCFWIPVSKETLH